DLVCVTESGAAVAGAERFVATAGRVRTTPTAASGAASPPGAGADGHALVVPAARTPRPYEPVEMSGPCRLVLPDGARVAGRVELLGDATDVPFLPELELSPTGFDPASLPPAFAGHVDVDALKQLRLRPDRGGFAFAGLPAGWSGSVGVG